MSQAVALHQRGELVPAKAIYQQVLRLHPPEPEGLRLLGTLELQLGNAAASAGLLRQYLSISPSQPGVHYNLGSALAAMGNLEDALATYDRALALRPDYVDAWFERGNAQLDLGRQDEALASYARAIALESGHVDAHNNRGNALLALGRLDEAAKSYTTAVTISPDFAGAHENLARVYEQQGLVDRALLQWRRMATQFDGASGAGRAFATTALNNMSRILQSLGDDSTAAGLLRKSLRLDPGQAQPAQDLLETRQRLCAWPVVETFEGVTRTNLMRGVLPVAMCALTDDPLLQLALNAQRNISAQADPSANLPALAPDTGQPGRLRIGYLSSDLREHAIGYLMYEVFGLHDRTEVEVFAYYTGPETSDPVHEHYKTQADHFIALGQVTATDAARRIREDGIHILVDINGHTLHSAKRIVARRPSPVIVNWLGFPGSMGSTHHHYIIADDWIIPPGNETYFSEKVLRLPCYQPNNRRRVVSPKTPARASAGLPDDAFVFCCFNGVRKLTRPTFERWLTILARAQSSVLWLLCDSGPARDRLKAHAQARGVDPSRIVFADTAPNAEHLARYPLADLFLDTAPYGAHTTCSDALWAGVPVITWSGRSFASRVCGSLVRQAGLPELVFTRAEDFIDAAVALAGDAERMSELKTRLRAMRDACVLFDTPGLVRALEGLYRDMWQDYLAGRLPRPDLRNLETYLTAGLGCDHEAIEVQGIEDYAGLWRGRLARLEQDGGPPVGLPPGL